MVVAVRLIVRRGPTIGAEHHGAVTLVAVYRTAWGVDRQLLMVGTDAVAMGVCIGEYAPLKHAVR
ncbi:hypothetical protein D9M71_839970 [compost metagenome]